MHKHFKRLHRREDWSHGLCHVTGSKGHDDPGSGLSLVTNSVQLELWAANLSQLRASICKTRELDSENGFDGPGFCYLPFVPTCPPNPRSTSCCHSLAHLAWEPDLLGPPRQGFLAGHTLDSANGRLWLEGFVRLGAPLHTSGFPGNGGAVASLSLQPHEW